LQFIDRLVESYENSNYTNVLIEQFVKLYIEPWRFNYLAKSWKCPKSEVNRAILSAEDWEKERQLFLAAGKNIVVNNTAEVCATAYNYGKSYLVWLEFIAPDNTVHKIDAWIQETGKNANFGKQGKNAEKFIDPRSPLCQDIYDSIVNKGYIDPNIAKLLNSVGSLTWTGNKEQRVQKKLNSFIQQKLFEKAVDYAIKNCKINVVLLQLDKFDDYLYKGDPGKLADYDLRITTSTDIFSARIDLKLLEDNDTAKNQNPHDADLLIVSNWRDAKVGFYRVTGNPGIEKTEEFQTILQLFNEMLISAGKCFIHISKIDEETGKVDFNMFGNI